jgi:hypothetical protein
MFRIQFSGGVAGRGTRTARRSRATARSGLLSGILTAATVLAFATNALAVSGTPINVGTPFESGPPAVAVDATGTAYVAWANTKDLPPVATNVVQYCVIPPDAVGCAHSGTLTPADNAAYVDGVQVLVDGSTIVVLADVYGASGGEALDYTPEQEWQSTDGGASFSIVNGGRSVTEGDIGGDTSPLSAVVVPGTGELGYGWNAAVAPPTFNAFPLSSPPECSEASGKCPAGFATLEPGTNPDQVTNGGGQFASQLGASPGILGIFNTLFTNGPLGCAASFGTAYAYGSGAQSATNNYNKSPGEPGSAWKVPIAQADCDVEYPAVAGGPSGFGVLEDDLAHNNVVYHRFDQATETFDTPEVTIAASAGEIDPAVSQDGTGGVYTTFLLGGPGGPISLAYSSDGGASWAGPSTLNANTDEGAGELTSAVGPSGQGWATWLDNGSVYAQQFVAADAFPPAVAAPPAPDTLTTIQTSGAKTGALLTISAGTVGETDRATLSGVNAAVATGTVTYTLYSQSSCVASSAVFHGGTSAVTGGLAAASAGVSAALAPGKYYWQTTYSGDAHNAASLSACGSEVLSVVPATSIEGGGTSSGTTVTITITCASTPCTVTITITVPAPSGKASAARKRTRRPQTITLATGKFTIKTKGPKKLSVHLTKAGRKLLARDHGHLKAKILVADATAGGLERSSRTITITAGKPKHKHKK